MAPPMVEVVLGDCVEVMAGWEDASIDAIVCDPPYGLEFMGKEWDKLSRNLLNPTSEADIARVKGYGNSYAGRCSKLPDLSGFAGRANEAQAWHTTWAREALRVLKPGGYLLAFGGSRTYHRLACAIEDAGFEIRDCVMWLYGSGFPKSLDVGKAIDKIDRVGPMRDRALRFTAWMRSTGITTAQINAATGTFMGSHYLTDKEQPAVATADLFDLLRPILPPVPAEIEELVRSRTVESENMKRRAVVGGHKGTSPGCNMRTGMLGGDKDEIGAVTAPYTDAARAWHGWGTALKPAHEPVVVARKPLEGTVAANVLKYGTGAVNIDGCRVPPTGEAIHAPQSDPAQRGGEVGRDLGFTANDAAKFRQAQRESIERTNTLGRWPANVIHDGSDDVVAGFPVTTSGDTGGSAARFFYCAKASRAEREAGLSAAAGERANRHPTVKPVAVMEYLLRLVMPPGGIALDPFAGSGTTLVAAARLGMNAIGIEREPEYHAIAEARIRAALAADPAAAPSPTDTDTEGEE